MTTSKVNVFFQVFFPVLLISFILLIFYSFRNNISENKIIDLDNTWEVILITDDGYENIKLAKSQFKKIYTFVPDKRGFIFLQNDFYIPEQLKNIDLGLYSGGMQIASEVFINGVSIGKEGFFPDDNGEYDFGPGTSGHSYRIPAQMLNVDGKNTLNVKLWVNGEGSISNGTYISDYESVYYAIEKRNFFFSKINFAFAISSLLISLFYFFIYISRRKDKANLYFSGMAFFSAFFLTPFFINELNWIPTDTMLYLTFNKLFFAIPAFISIDFSASFINYFLNFHQSKKTVILRISVLLLTIILTFLIPDYVTYCKYLFWLMGLACSQMLFAVFDIIKAFVHKNKNLMPLLGSFFPIVACLIIDLIVRVILKTDRYPIFSIYGWQFTIIVFLYILSVRYNAVYSQYEYLAKELENEVQMKTKDLSVANKKLIHEQDIAKQDMDMAVHVQQTFLPSSSRQFKGWDLAVTYKPQSGVSGDFYDYYSFDGNLNGISLFDVSGHGISAGLITMLSKVIVAENFTDGYKDNLALEDIMDNINNSIILAKENVENYLTGILVKFNETDDGMTADIVRAGHPAPIVYSRENDSTVYANLELNKQECCVVGIDGIPVTFMSKSYDIKNDDIIVIYSDGITEAENENGESYGKERLARFIKEHCAFSAKQLNYSLMTNLKNFIGKMPLNDDMTVLILKRTV